MRARIPPRRPHSLFTAPFLAHPHPVAVEDREGGRKFFYFLLRLQKQYGRKNLTNPPPTGLYSGAKMGMYEQRKHRTTDIPNGIY